MADTMTSPPVLEGPHNASGYEWDQGGEPSGPPRWVLVLITLALVGAIGGAGFYLFMGSAFAAGPAGSCGGG